MGVGGRDDRDHLALARTVLPKIKLGQAVNYTLSQWPETEALFPEGRVCCSNAARNRALEAPLL